jgi:hypothetical protein
VPELIGDEPAHGQQQSRGHRSRLESPDGRRSAARIELRTRDSR